MKIIYKLMQVLAAPVILITACSYSDERTEQTTTETISFDEFVDDTYYDSICTINLGDTVEIEGDGAWVNDRIISITKGGEFVLNGTLSDGMLYINTNQRVMLTLKGVNITNTKGSALYIANSQYTTVNIAEDTTNYLTDCTEYSFDGADEDRSADVPCAALYSSSDIVFMGKGSLNVTGKYKDGIHSMGNIDVDECKINISAVASPLYAAGTITTGDDCITANSIN